MQLCAFPAIDFSPPARHRCAGVARPGDASGDELREFALAAMEVGARITAIWGSDESPARPGLSLHCVFGLDGRPRLGQPRPAGRSAGYPTSPTSSRRQPHAARHARHGRHRQLSAATSVPGCATAAGRRAGIRCATTRASRRAPDRPTDYDFVKVGGEGAHEIPGRSHPCRHHRAGPLPFFGGRRTRAQAGAASGLPAQGRGKRCSSVPMSHAARNWLAASRAIRACAYAWAYADAVEAACGV
jgi:hypothetical protein